jgi:hypothetical protein
MVGLLRNEFVVIPQPELKDTMRSLRAFKARSRNNRGPYSANGLFDTGAEILVSGERGIFDNFVRMDPPLEVEGVGGNVMACTHEGDVTMKLGPATLKLHGYYCEQEESTLLPGTTFGSGGYYFLGINRSLSIGLSTPEGELEELTRFPRDVVVGPKALHSPAFLQCLNQQTSSTKRQHVLYPIPDNAFVWYEPPTPRVLVSTRSQEATGQSPSKAVSFADADSLPADSTPHV